MTRVLTESVISTQGAEQVAPEIVERMAEAIFLADNNPSYSWQEDAKPWERDEYRAMARAALGALREPTSEMIDALWTKEEEMRGGGCGREMFRAAIDAALGRLSKD